MEVSNLQTLCECFCIHESVKCTDFVTCFYVTRYKHADVKL